MVAGNPLRRAGSRAVEASRHAAYLQIAPTSPNRPRSQ